MQSSFHPQLAPRESPRRRPASAFLAQWLPLALASLSLLLTSCGDSDPIYPNVPEITFNRIMPKEVNEVTSFEDDLELQISIDYQDGDGDLGGDGGAKEFDFIMKDLREEVPILDIGVKDTVINGNPTQVADTTVVYDGLLKFKMPDLSTDARTPSIQGTIDLQVSSGLRRIPRNNPPQVDTVRFEVWLFDRAGNESNHVVTDPIAILPSN